MSGGQDAQRSTTMHEEFVYTQVDILGDLAHQRRSDVTTWMERYCGAATIDMTVLPVRPTLPNELKVEGFEELDDFSGLEDWNVSHAQATTRFCVPTNSASSWGSPSSNNIATTSCKLH